MEEKKNTIFKFSSTIAFIYIFAFFFFTNRLFRFTKVFFEPTFAGSGYIDNYRFPSCANYLVHFIVVIIIIILFALSANKAKKGSIRATLVTLGFLLYLFYTSIFYIYFSFEEIGFFTAIAFFIILILSFYDLVEGMDFVNANEIRKSLSHKCYICIITILFFTATIFLLMVNIFEISSEFPEYWVQIAFETIFLGKGFEVAPLTSFQITPFILIPVLIISIYMLFMDIKWGYVFSLMLLVMFAVQSIYIIKIVSFIIELTIASNEIHDVKSMHFEDIYSHLNDIKEITYYTIKRGIPWAIRIIVSMILGVIALIFLKNIPSDILLQENANKTVNTKSQKDTD